MTVPEAFRKNFSRADYASAYVDGVGVARKTLRQGYSGAKVRDDVEMLVRELQASASHGHASIGRNVGEGRITGYLHQTAHLFDAARAAGFAFARGAQPDVLALERALPAISTRPAWVLGYVRGWSAAGIALEATGTAAVVDDVPGWIDSIAKAANLTWSAKGRESRSEASRATAEALGGFFGYVAVLAGAIDGLAHHGVQFNFRDGPNATLLKNGTGRFDLDVTISRLARSSRSGGEAETSARATLVERQG